MGTANTEHRRRSRREAFGVQCSAFDVRCFPKLAPPATLIGLLENNFTRCGQGGAARRRGVARQKIILSLVAPVKQGRRLACPSLARGFSMNPKRELIPVLAPTGLKV